MRTAAFYLNKNEITERSIYFSRAVAAINEARKQTIERCVEISLTEKPEDISGKILNLINELQ